MIFDPLLLVHKTANAVLPGLMNVQRRLTKNGYQKLLFSYRLDFMRRQKHYPLGVPYRLLGVQPLSENTLAYRFQAPSGIRHEAGNTLLLKWRNRAEEVAQLIESCGWSPNTNVRFRTNSSAFLPGAWVTLTLEELLMDHIEIRNPSLGLIELLTSGASKSVAQENLTLAALLMRYQHQVDLQPETLARLQPRINPRSYSISNIWRNSDKGDEVEVLVSNVNDTHKDISNSVLTLPGRCSGYLTTLNPDDITYGWPLRFPLTLHAQGREQHPLLVIATGIASAAPILEWKENAQQRPLWLVLGMRNADSENGLLQRIMEFAEAFPDVRIDIALSQSEAPNLQALQKSNCYWHGKSRVQNVLTTQQSRLKQHFSCVGDVVVVGHTSMGHAVQQLLKQLLVDEEAHSNTKMSNLTIQQLEADLRLQYSLSGR